MTETTVSGENALQLGTNSGGRRQNVSLQPNKTYALTGWAKLSNLEQKASLRISIDGQLYRAPITSTTYQRYAITFTTPISFAVWPPHVTLWKLADSGGYVYFDELKLNEYCRDPQSGEPIEEVPVNEVIKDAEAAPPQLSEENAMRQTDDKVRLTWRLSATTGLSGFVVYRSLTDSIAEADEITDNRIAVNGTTFKYVDTTAAPNSIYTYWLSLVTINGSSTEFRLGEVIPNEPALDANQVFLPLVWRE